MFHIFEIVFAWLCSLLVMLSGDVEVNPGPKNKDKDCLSICHWNLNSISAYDYSKLFLLNSYNSLHKFDIICLSETYLDSNTPLNDDNLKISGYTLVRSDHPSNTKRGGVCLYYKNSLPLRVINIGYLNECLTLELTVGDKTCNFVVLYRSPSQSQDEFGAFSDNFETILDILAQQNPFLITTIGDFNAKSKNWYCQDKTSFEGKNMKSITSQFGLFNETILNVLSNYIPHETLICDDKDPPWFNSRIKYSFAG